MNKRSNIRNNVVTAIFIALMLVLGMLPIGYIPLGFINISILAIPIIIGTIVLGLPRGMILGAFFALTSTLSMVGASPMVPPSTLANNLFVQSPALAIVMCVVPRLLIPVTTHYSYKLFTIKKSSRLLVAPAAVIGSLTNTVFYLGLMFLFYTLVMSAEDTAAVSALIGGTALIAGPLEAVAAGLLATPICAALLHTGRKAVAAHIDDKTEETK